MNGWVPRIPAGNTSWAKRVDDLLRATGWPYVEWKKHFGFGPKAVQRVRIGGRPSVKFVRRLKQLEVAYAEHLEALRAGYITFRGHRRFCRVEFEKPGRPEDLQALGETLGAAAPLPDARRGVGGEVPRGTRAGDEGDAAARP